MSQKTCLENELERVKSENEKLFSDLEATEIKINACDEIVETMRPELSELYTKVAAKDQQLLSIRAECSKLQDLIDENKSKSSEEVFHLKTERDAQHQKIESLEARILETKSESGKMLEALKEENAKNEADLKTAREHLEEASSKIHQLTVDNNFLVSEMEDKATAIELKKDCELYSLEESLEKMENLLLAKDSFCDKILAERDLNAQEITSLKFDTDRCGH